MNLIAQSIRDAALSQDAYCEDDFVRSVLYAATGMGQHLYSLHDDDLRTFMLIVAEVLS